VTSVRVKIDVASGLIELEGEEDFVSTYLEKLLPMVQAAGFGGTAHLDNGARDETSDAESDGLAATENPIADGAKKKRKLGRRPPAGTSCRDRILILKGDGFFKNHHSTTEIVDGLAKKGWTYKSNQVGAALTVMFEKGEIQRTKDSSKSGFSYYWDRHS
jgi:hypothetical protein